MLGCMLRINASKMFYFSLVRSVLEYNILNWDRSEKITLNYRHNQTLLSVDYIICLRKYRIMSLKKRILSQEVNSENRCPTWLTGWKNKEHNVFDTVHWTRDFQVGKY